MGTHPIFESDFDCLTAFRMEIICAGYPKTGSKSCSAALRVLGYNVADYIETLEFFGETWQDFFDGKIDAKAVLDKYKEEGFDANQDFPGNFLWEELYQVSPAGQKVILTVRDSDEKWWKSWCGFFTQESKRHAIGDINLGIILTKASEYGYMGPKFQVMFEVGKLVCSRYLSPALFDTKWSVQKQIEIVTREETRLKQGYRKHNAYVIATVPKENLLVWNLKEGWEPLCKFLNRPIPNEPIPHDKNNIRFRQGCIAWICGLQNVLNKRRMVACKDSIFEKHKISLNENSASKNRQVIQSLLLYIYKSFV